ncbi:MAG: hypothetical protein ABI718_15375 [Acidobacteriota bacterium]
MMKSRMVVASIAASMFCSVFAAEPPKAVVTLVDAGPDVFAEGSPVVDVVKLELSSDGKFIVIAATLADAPKPASLLDALIAGVSIDVDNNPKTGGEGLDGYYADMPGMEFDSELIASVEDDGGAARSSSSSLINIAEKSNVLTSSDAVHTAAKGKVYTGRIAYTDIGAKSGQIIRIVAREAGDRGETAGIFPEAVLKLK